MATSAQSHFRSISLPSRLNPTNFESELQKLKSCHVSKAGTTLTSQSIQPGLLGLAELYNSVEELINQSSTSKELQNGDVIEESLEGSIQLLDSCSTIKDLFQSIKENVQSLQSALRRKGLDSTIQNDIGTYFSFRKKMNKCIAKSLKTLKNLENKKTSTNADNSDFLSKVLGEVMGVSIAILKSILVFLSSQVAKNGRWSLVSKLVLTKSMTSSVRDDSIVNEMDSVDVALNNLNDVQSVQRSLQNLEGCIEGFESGIDRLFRQLILCRVAFLNIVTHH